MCGICGFTGDRVESKAVLKEMMDKIIHRGPDSEGKFLDGDISMGFRRLSIIDLDNGSQPMENVENTHVISFNGEIYNYREIREELLKKGYVFQTQSDTEVILNGFLEYGEKILEKLRGMFAFVIWNRKKKRLFGARDMFGIKPFYYAVIDRELVYASEIKSILSYPKYQKEVNKEALEEYLSFQYSVLEETFFKGIYKLGAGHCFTWEKGKIEEKQYFDPMLLPKKKDNEKELTEKIEETLKESIRYHMVSDVEVGSLLSSGVDSSFVATQFGGGKTFTVGFDYEKYNEIPYAKELSKRLGIENYSKVITTEEFWKEIPKIQYHMDEPLADPAAAALYFVDREASKHVKVVLSGEGADELFGGYNIYKEPMALERYQKLPKGVRKGLAGIAENLPFRMKGKNFLIRGSKPVEERFIGNANIFSVKQRRKVLKFQTESTPKKRTEAFYKKAENLDDVAKMQYIDLHFWLVGDILLKADKMSMAHSLESRVPFLDREVFRLARDLPLSEKVDETNTKVAFRRVAKRYLTEEGAKKKKLGFPVPIRIWLREEKYYQIVKEAFLSERAEEFFYREEILKLLEAHKKGKADYSRHIWTVYMFLVWHKEFFNEKKGEKV